MRTLRRMNKADLFYYPLNGWQAGRRFICTTWPQASHAVGPGFKAADTPGTFSCNDPTVDWNFNLHAEAVEPAPRIWCLANGIVLAAADKPTLLAAQFVVRTHAWTGFALLPCIPTLFSAADEVQTVAENRQLLAVNGLHIALLRQPTERGLRFAWAVSESDPEAALAEAEAALEIDATERAQEEIACRLKALEAQRNQTEVARNMQASALEALIAALRPPQGHLTHCWSESTAHPGAFYLNELLPLVDAWSRVDRHIAMQLIGAALDTQTEDGILPAWSFPDGTASTQSMWPALATSLRTQLNDPESGNDERPEQAWAAAARGLVKMLDFFERQGRYRWRTAEEAFIPDLFDEQLLTIDVAALLLAECEACMLAAQRGIYVDPLDIEAIRASRTPLQRQLTETLWNSATGSFCDRYTGGAFIRRRTAGRFLPLASTSLPQNLSDTVWEQLSSAKEFKPDAGLRLWEHWESDPIEPPVAPLQNYYIWHAAKSRRAAEEFLPLADRWYAALLKQHQQALKQDADAAEEADPPAPVRAALALTLNQRVQEASSQKVQPKWLLWLDRHRMGVLVCVAGPLLAILIGISIYLLIKPDPTDVDMEAIHSVAQRHYEDGDYDQAIALYQELYRFLPKSPTVNHRLGNALFRAGRYAEAEEHYRRAIDEEWPMPRSLRNLAITLHRQGRLDEATTYFELLIELYAEHYPELAAQATIALDIIRAQSQ